MVLSHEFIDAVARWQHKVVMPKGLLSAVKPPKVYDVFTVHFKSWLRPREKIVIARNVSRVNNIWQHTPTDYAQTVHKELSAVGEGSKTELQGPHQFNQ